jgi:uncharacterized protein (TIRG00374 family)
MVTWLKRLLGLAILAVVLHLFWQNMLSLKFQDSVQEFRSAHWGWLVVAASAEIVSYFSLAWLNMLTLKPFGDYIGMRDTLGMLCAVACAEVALPSAGVSGVAVRARLLSRYGYSVEVSGLSLLIESVFIASSMGVVVLLGGVHLFQHSGPRLQGLLLLVGLAAVIVLWAGWEVMFSPERSGRIITWGARAWNGLFGRWRPMGHDAIEGRLAVFQRGVRALGEVPRWQFLVAAYGRVLLDIATLGFCFFLFGRHVGVGRLFTGFGLMMLMSTLAALPFGLGVADLALPMIFVRRGVPFNIALAAGLTYRLIGFWMPRFIGYVTWTVMESLCHKPPPPRRTKPAPGATMGSQVSGARGAPESGGPNHEQATTVSDTSGAGLRGNDLGGEDGR